MKIQIIKSKKFLSWNIRNIWMYTMNNSLISRLSIFSYVLARRKSWNICVAWFLSRRGENAQCALTPCSKRRVNDGKFLQWKYQAFVPDVYYLYIFLERWGILFPYGRRIFFFLFTVTERNSQIPLLPAILMEISLMEILPNNVIRFDVKFAR